MALKESSPHLYPTNYHFEQTKYKESLDRVEPAASRLLRDAKAPIHYENSMHCSKHDSMRGSVWGAILTD